MYTFAPVYANNRPEFGKTMHKNANESMFLTAHRQKFIERKETERTIYFKFHK